ncbi:MAG: DUF5719 family protein [Candidatus Geothermincolia bacterium]
MRTHTALRSATLATLLLIIALNLLPAYAVASGGGPGSSIAPSAVSKAWYFAEGTTAYGFEEYVCIQNPSQFDSTVNLVYMLPDPKGQVAGEPFILKAYSRATVNVADITPGTDVSVKVESSQGVICERSMYWGGRVEGHNSIGITAPGTKWYLAEGCTNYGFEEFLSLQNPLSSSAAVTITYNTSAGPVSKPAISLAARARKTIRVNDIVPADDVSITVSSDKPVVAERSMYWDGRRGGHDSIGTEAPAREWFLAEGSTKWGFDTYVLVQNPGTIDASVKMEFLSEKGLVNGPDLLVKAGSRRTVDTKTVVGAADFSTKITSDRDVVCERSMYWNNGTGKAGHDTIGVKQSAYTWFLAEGTTLYGFETFVLIANPSAEANDVIVTYMTPAGLEYGPQVTVPPYSRVTVNVNADLPGRDVSVKLEGNAMIAERAMYWNGRGGGHCSTGCAQEL